MARDVGRASVAGRRAESGPAVLRASLPAGGADRPSRRSPFSWCAAAWRLRRGSTARAIRPRSVPWRVPPVGSLSVEASTTVRPSPGRRRPESDVLRPGVDSGQLLVLGIGLEDQITHALLGVGVGNGPQQREAAPLTVDGVL